MQVLLINGSPHEAGCTFTALSEVASSLEKNGIETNFFHIGKKPVHGCVACYGCTKTGKCAFDDDVCNTISALADKADGIVIGSPVYFASANGALCALLDRAFFAASNAFIGKPGAAIVSCRRGGAGSAFDRLNKYFTISQMPVVASQYWNAVHGSTPEDVRRDEEGLQIMRTLGANMAWLLKSIAEGKVPRPEQEKRLRTNFIR